MPLRLQASLLSFLERREFSPLNSKRKVHVNCWVLAATNGNLEKLTHEGLFREDLFRQLNIIRVLIPPLRQRPEDIEPLVHYFAEQFACGFERPRFKFSDNNMMDALAQYSWPGNVSELRRMVRRLVSMDEWEAAERELALSG